MRNTPRLNSIPRPLAAGNAMHPADDGCYIAVMQMYAVVLFATIFPAFVLYVWGAAALVAVYRGPNFVQWRAPRHCAGLLHWLAFEWDYAGLSGTQRGARALGLEVAFDGVLRPRL
jgi:hypothetical protein